MNPQRGTPSYIRVGLIAAIYWSAIYVFLVLFGIARLPEDTLLWGLGAFALLGVVSGSILAAVRVRAKARTGEVIPTAAYLITSPIAAVAALEAFSAPLEPFFLVALALVLGLIPLVIAVVFGRWIASSID